MSPLLSLSCSRDSRVYTANNSIMVIMRPLVLLLLLPYLCLNGSCMGKKIITVLDKGCLIEAGDENGTNVIRRSIEQSVVKGLFDVEEKSLKLDVTLVEDKKDFKRYVYSRAKGNETSSVDCVIQVEMLKHVDAVVLDIPVCLHPYNKSWPKDEEVAVTPDTIKALLGKSDCIKLVEANTEFWPHAFDNPSDKTSSDLLRIDAKNTTNPSNSADPYRGLQWYLNENEKYSIKPELAWDISKGGTGSVEEQPMNTIGVVDFGTEQDHEDLVDKWWENKREICGNGIDDDDNGKVDDCRGWNTIDSADLKWTTVHGTLIAGAIGASTFNGLGISSICRNCRMLPVTTNGYASQILDGINYIIGNGVKIINLSFGGGASPVLEHAMKANPDVLFVASAGNAHCNLDDLPGDICFYKSRRSGYPAIYSETLLNVVSVASYDITGNKSKFSSYSPKLNRVQIAAPGSHIFTTYQGGGYRIWNGASFGTAITSGISVLIQFQFPWLKACQIRRSLSSGCIKTDALETVSSCGGFINARKALDAARIIDMTGDDRCSTDPVLVENSQNSFSDMIIHFFAVFGITL